MEGRKITMGAKRPPLPVLQIKGPETVTQPAYDRHDSLTMSEPITPSSSSCSPSSSPPLPGSAVYALQSKVKALSQKKTIGKERNDQPQEPKWLLTQKKKEEASSSSPMHHPQSDLPSSSDEEGMDQVQRNVFAYDHSSLGEQRAQAASESEGGRESPFLSVAGQTRGLGEGASLESLLTDGSGGLQEDTLTSRSSSTMSSSSRSWAPPKGFWRVARPETLILDAENASKDMPPPGADGFQGKPKMKIGGAELDSFKELHHSDSLESHHRRCWQREASTEESSEGVWRADSLDNESPQGGTPFLPERVERNQRTLRQMQTLCRHNAPGTEETAADLDRQHCQGDYVRGAESSGKEAYPLYAFCSSGLLDFIWYFQSVNKMILKGILYKLNSLNTSGRLYSSCDETYVPGLISVSLTHLLWIYPIQLDDWRQSTIQVAFQISCVACVHLRCFYALSLMCLNIVLHYVLYRMYNVRMTIRPSFLCNPARIMSRSHTQSPLPPHGHCEQMCCPLAVITGLGEGREPELQWHHRVMF